MGSILLSWGHKGALSFCRGNIVGHYYYVLAYKGHYYCVSGTKRSTITVWDQTVRILLLQGTEKIIIMLWGCHYSLGHNMGQYFSTIFVRALSIWHYFFRGTVCVANIFLGIIIVTAPLFLQYSFVEHCAAQQVQ